MKTTNDLEKELGDSVTASVRKNEGEAAMYGIYYDDTEYDYMQHLRDIGTSSGAVFVEAPQPQSKQKTGKKMKLEDALRGVNEPPDLASLLPAELLPSDKLVKRTYQDQQNIPDVLAGFQPDMDPRLREVLEALEDEAYVDDDEDVFGELTKDGEKGVVSDEFLNQDGFLEGELDDYDDGGWATDDTETPTKKQGASKAIPDKPSSKSVSFPDAKSKDIDSNDAWLAEFSKFKRAQKSPQTKDQEEIASSIGDTMSLGSEYTLGGSRARRKRRGARAARTASTGYSMSSSSLYRTEGLTMLDDRFEKVGLITLNCVPSPLLTSNSQTRLKKNTPTLMTHTAMLMIPRLLLEKNL